MACPCHGTLIADYILELKSGAFCDLLTSHSIIGVTCIKNIGIAQIIISLVASTEDDKLSIAELGHKGINSWGQMYFDIPPLSLMLTAGYCFSRIETLYAAQV